MIDLGAQARVQGGGPQPFSLLGGPLHRIGCRLGLVWHGTNTVPLGLAIALPLWGVLLVLALIDGHDPLSYTAIGAHARLLLVIPLMFVCEAVLDPQLTVALRVIARSGVVTEPSLPALGALVARATRLKDAWWPEALCLLLAIALTLLGPLLHVPGTAGYGFDLATNELTPTAWWYWNVCLTVMRFLMLRWLWRLVLWTYCLWRISRLRLQLLAGHHDGVAGLGHFEVVQSHFAPLVMAISAATAGSFAADIGGGKLALESALPGIGVLLIADAVLFIAPLLVFVPALWACRLKGMSDYMVLSERYVAEFESKWLPDASNAGGPVLGSSDIQSMADLGSSVERVQRMRMVPVSLRMMTVLLGAALLPMLPLALFKYPLTEWVQQILIRMTGM